MAVKSVIDIDVDDAKFQRFNEIFKRYKTALEETKGTWGEIAKGQEELAERTQRIVAATLAANEAAKEGAEEEDHKVERLEKSERLWVSIHRSSAGVAKSILDIGAGIIKWGGALAGGLLGGSLWGLDRMAESTSDNRRRAMGLGTNIGEMRSFDINFQRAVDPNFLDKVNEMRNDPSKAWSLATMGVRSGGDTTQTAVELLKAMYNKAHTTNMPLGMLDTITGLGVGTQAWQRLKTMQPQEFQQLLGQYQKGVGAMEPGERNAKAWTDFVTQLETAGESIKNVFVKGLAPLAPSLTKLSDAIVHLVQHAFPASGDGPIQKGIDKLSTELDKFAKYIGSDKFLTDVDRFVSGTGQLADAIDAIVDAVHHPGKAFLSYQQHMIDKQMGWVKDALTGAMTWVTNGVAGAQLGMVDSAAGLPKGTADFLWGKESGRSFNPRDNGDAQGPFQIKKSMQGGADPYSFADSAERADWLVKDEMNRHPDFDIQKAIAAYHFGDTLFAQALKGGKNWMDTPVNVGGGKTETARGYLAGLHITVQDKTGGQTEVIVNGIVGGQGSGGM